MSPEAAAIVAAIGTIAGLLGVLFAIRANRFAKAVAEAQRVFEKPILSVAVSGDHEVDDLELALPFKNGRIVDFPIPWSISNTGDKSASDVMLSVRCNSELRYKGVAKLKWEQVIPGSSLVTTSQGDNFVTLIVEFRAIHPKTSIRMIDRISLRGPTTIKSSVDATTADNVRVTIPYELEYAFVIDCALMYRDARPIAKRYSIMVHNTAGRSVKEYFDEYNANAHRREQRESVSLTGWKKMIARFFRTRPAAATRFTLLYVDKAPVQHPQFQGLPIDQVVPEMVNICAGVRFPNGVLVPALNIVPSTGIETKDTAA